MAAHALVGVPYTTDVWSFFWILFITCECLTDSVGAPYTTGAPYNRYVRKILGWVQVRSKPLDPLDVWIFRHFLEQISDKKIHTDPVFAHTGGELNPVHRQIRGEGGILELVPDEPYRTWGINGALEPGISNPKTKKTLTSDFACTGGESGPIYRNNLRESGY
ncbi:hypothetical protein B0H14DRAFT_2577580 [Mycena olivaceomarginata]|nr:hypothetical protein B0H14DRAFT_2577580 [Mycena olivaceomarginata]